MTEEVTSDSVLTEIANTLDLPDAELNQAADIKYSDEEPKEEPEVEEE